MKWQLCVILVLLASRARAADLGIQLGSGGDLVRIPVIFVRPYGPAERAGLRAADEIVAVDGEAVTGIESVRARIAALAVGDILDLTVRRGSTTVDGGAAFEDLRLRVEAGPDRAIVLPPDENAAIRHPIAAEVDGWLVEHGLVEATADLRRRLAALEVTGDPDRLPGISAIHREPFALSTIARAGLDRLSDAAQLGPPELYAAIAGFYPVAARATPGELPAPPSSSELEAWLDHVEALLNLAHAARDQAFAVLTEDDRQHILAHWSELPGRLEEHIYLHVDQDPDRLRNNYRTLEIARCVDLGALLEAYRIAATIASPGVIDGIVAAALAQGDVSADTVIRRDTPHGAIVVNGTGSRWSRETDVAVRVDLGGDDFHANGAGSTLLEGPDRSTIAGPGIQILVDVAGDDAYESTRDGGQGAGILGIGILVDRSGDDTYLATRAAQGFGFLGVGLLRDGGGNDRYRVETFGQGVAFCGGGGVVDLGGDDRYEAREYSQGLGLPRGVGFVVDSAGDDEYFAKGRAPTVYGDIGIYDAWSQGCGLGLRGEASGGVGVLIDGDGDDRYEAGSFSQGGGYYYGFGLLEDRGAGDDRYLGSRYDQGFSAHQAAGFFRDAGGNDRYHTRQSVVSGLAWDQSVSFFIEEGGDDIYTGGGFSLGASAHNAVCVFLELGGTDEYRYAAIGRARPNDYHGGASLSVFVDEGGGADRYSGDDRNDRVTVEPEHGIVVDR